MLVKVSFLLDGDGSKVAQRARRRISGFFGRLSRRHHKAFGSFRPTVASTPRQRPTSMYSTSNTLKEINGSCSETLSIDKLDLENGSKYSDDQSKDKACCYTVSSSSPVFRVPVAPPRYNRNRSTRCSAVSLDAAISNCSPAAKR